MFVSSWLITLTSREIIMSDRTKLDLINRIRNGEPLPVIHEESPTPIQVASLPQLIESSIFEYNPDGTLKNAQIGNKNLKFVWNSNGTLHKINTYTVK